MKTFTCTLTTPDAVLFKGEVLSVACATETGQMEAFPGHAPLSATILFSHLRLKQEQYEETFLVRQGLIFIHQASVEILAFSAHKEKEVDYKSMHDYLEFITKSLGDRELLNEFQIVHLSEERVAIEHMLQKGKATSKEIE